MMGNVNATIKTNVRQVEETYQSVLNIQRSMVQLNQMFMDLAYLVNEQGESLKVALLARCDTQVKMDSLKDHIANHKNSMIESDVK